jgi:hypothetical protein
MAFLTATTREILIAGKNTLQENAPGMLISLFLIGAGMVLLQNPAMHSMALKDIEFFLPSPTQRINAACREASVKSLQSGGQGSTMEVKIPQRGNSPAVTYQCSVGRAPQ